MLKVISYIKHSQSEKLYLRDLRIDYTNVSNGLWKKLKQELLMNDLN